MSLWSGREEAAEIAENALETRSGDKNCQSADALWRVTGPIGARKTAIVLAIAYETKGVTCAPPITLGSTVWRVKCDTVHVVLQD